MRRFRPSLGEVLPLPGLCGVRSARWCASCGHHREVEGWRVELAARVEWRRSSVEGAVPVCGACLVRALVALVRSGRSSWVEGRGGSWLRRRNRGGELVESMGPMAWRRALRLGLAGESSVLAPLRGMIGEEIKP